MRKIFLLVLLTACTLVRARAASAQSTAWVEVQSPHFTVVSDAGQDEARATARRFERVRAVFQKAFPQMRVYPPIPLVILAARDVESFESMQPASWSKPGEASHIGLLLRNPDKDYILLRLGVGGEHPYRTIYHEYAHLILEDNFRSIPLWLNEGLAQLYAASDLTGKTVRLGLPSEKSLGLLRSNPLLPLPLLFAVTNSSPYYNEASKDTIFYAESWALTDYLMFQKRGVSGGPINEYLRLTAQGLDPMEAARQSFGGLDALQSALQAFVHNRSFHYYRLKVPSSAGASAWPVRKLTAAESAAIRGGFMVRDGRYGEARALLAQALSANPPVLSAAESMGLLELRTGNPGKAAVWFAQAAEHCPQCRLARLYRALEILHSNPTQTEADLAIRDLEDFTRFNPVFSPPFAAIATFYAERHERLTEALHCAEQASRIDPTHLPYLFLEGRILLEMGNTPAALKVARLAIEKARSPQEKSLAYVFLGTLQAAQPTKAGGAPPANRSPE